MDNFLTISDYKKLLDFAKKVFTIRSNFLNTVLELLNTEFNYQMTFYTIYKAQKDTNWYAAVKSQSNFFENAFLTQNVPSAINDPQFYNFLVYSKNHNGWQGIALSSEMPEFHDTLFYKNFSKRNIASAALLAIDDNPGIILFILKSKEEADFSPAERQRLVEIRDILRKAFIAYKNLHPQYNKESQIIVPELTKREAEIWNLISQGKTNEEIANILTISYHTVKTHIFNLFKKLHVSNRTEAIQLKEKQKHYSF